MSQMLITPRLEAENISVSLLLKETAETSVGYDGWFVWFPNDFSTTSFPIFHKWVLYLSSPVTK